MPSKLLKLLRKYDAWNVRTVPEYRYCEIYSAGGVDRFKLTWYDMLSKPCITYLDV